MGQAWWLTYFIPALRRLGQEDLELPHRLGIESLSQKQALEKLKQDCHAFEKVSLHSEFWASMGYRT